ncbi:hypothetical protein [Bacillus sp. NPDC094106]|uniref:hypothetical protein n=1 Tax=Bacillus sp. NPDC094106 TaxID=3363949 RepID=UPI003810398C
MTNKKFNEAFKKMVVELYRSGQPAKQFITSVNQAALYRKLKKPNKNQKTDSLNT